MKLLYELGSCFYSGGATVTPPSATEACFSGLRSNSRLRDDQRGGTTNYSGGGIGSGSDSGSSHEVGVPTVTGLRKTRSTKASRNWKPKLHVISEDGVVMNRDSPNNILSAKVKAKSKPKPPISYVSGDDYWKSSRLWAVPAFSPAPFAF